MPTSHCCKVFEDLFRPDKGVPVKLQTKALATTMGHRSKIGLVSVL